MTVTQERVTVAVACKALGISQRTIYRLLKDGRLTKIKEGHRTYIPMADIRAMRQELAQSVAQKKTANVTGKVAQLAEVVSISKEKYEALLTELGELRERNKLLLEYKVTHNKKLEEMKRQIHEAELRLADSKTQLEESETEIARLKKPLFKRIVEQVIKK